ncbi:glucosylglycerol-phosphate synthase [Synechococcus sp. PCC 7336]|uniref:glucosylglycerol-phosphate synthase n=1 Tax=Synechococcus sp. PCC 7336 TaxID=195250 RepID=UPI00034D92B9|nr:glucosylglycerol-phosphate synthase [Synechococcus sp. PCC 7336]
MREKSSLVILYHREPYDEVRKDGKVFYQEKKKPNGIVPTLKSFFLNADQSTWIAWKQVTTRQRETFQETVSVGEGENCIVRRIPLSSQEVRDFYHITSKEAFWPILHSFPSQFTYDTANWENFKYINQLFADAACKEAADDALIWVHDYNLWLAPAFIREKKPNVRIAFFHHTPFPSADIFGILPWRQAIVDSLLCCDLLGFHIPRYVENFVSAAGSVRHLEVLERGEVDDAFTKLGPALAQREMTTKVQYGDRTIRLDAFPVGTNPKLIDSILEKPETSQRIAKIREEIGDCKLILSAGRVDYVKGTRELLLSYERLLERRPELHSKVILLNVSVAAAEGMRVYREYRQEIEQLAGKINGRFATLNWVPIRLFTKPFPFEEIVAYYRAADVAFIPPLRDGLNLVAKEYIAAKQGTGGALILSEFTGSAVELPDAILANPHSFMSLNNSLDEALDMPLEEQQRRMQKLYKAVTRYDVNQWANHLFREAMAIDNSGAEKFLATIT